MTQIMNTFVTLVVTLLLLASCAVPATTMPKIEPNGPTQVAAVAPSAQPPSNSPPGPTAPTTSNPPTVPGGLAQILILNNEFSPRSITVSVGTRVIWKNQSNHVQTVYSDGEVIDGLPLVYVIASELKPGDAVGYAFSMSGSYPYYSQMDPEMTGVVIVQ